MLANSPSLWFLIEISHSSRKPHDSGNNCGGILSISSREILQVVKSLYICDGKPTSQCRIHSADLDTSTWDAEFFEIDVTFIVIGVVATQKASSAKISVAAHNFPLSKDS